jgi:small subunit ribosomal protein S2
MLPQLAGAFILGLLVGWVIEWIFVRLFVPNPKKKVEAALQASRKENDHLQQQNRALQAALDAAKAANVPAAIVAPVVVAAPVVEETPVAAPEPVATEASVEANAEADDLTKLSGIGPKLAEAMNNAGINHYALLAELSVETVAERLASSGIRYSKASAESWAKQASFAGQKDWDGLKAYQATLKN